MRPNRTAPLSLHSIWFAYPGASDAILLRDHRDDKLVAATTPEWTAAEGLRAPAAYVSGARPTIQVRLSRSTAARSRGVRVPGRSDPVCTIYATGAGGPGTRPRKIRLQFDNMGLSKPIAFRLSEPLPDRSGPLQLEWSWRLRVAAQEFALGTSSHDILLTARPILDPAPWLDEKPKDKARRAPWAYSRILEWTCDWTAGLDDEKAIVDAIMRNLPRSGLKYAVKAWDVLRMLVQGGGMCGGWGKMFQAMAASQGVSLERRAFSLQQLPQAGLGGKMTWSGVVIRRGGINRVEPAGGSASRTFDDIVLKPDARPTVAMVADTRYCFGDGHVFNVLRHRKSWYLYDPSFLMGPIRLDRQLPKLDGNQLRDVAGMGNFYRDYLSRTVDFMRGTLQWGSQGPAAKDVTVPIALLNSPGTLSFYLF